MKTGNQIFPALLFFLLGFFGPGSGSAQIILDEEPRRLYYHLTKRKTKLREMQNFRDVFHYDHFLLGKNRISGNISWNTGRVIIDERGNIHNERRNAMGFFTRIRFLEEFSFNTTFYKDYNSEAQARWIADYTYSIGRYNWRANRLNFGYENYINNKYRDDLETFGKKFLEGYYFVSYNQFPTKLNKKIKLDSTTKLRLVWFWRYAIRYRDENEITHGGIFRGKATLGGAARYTIIKNFYIETAVYYYPSIRKKQPWDPDFSYGFGYFDWRSFRVSVTYGNWAINRFPWNNQQYKNYGFIDGNFRVAANWIW